MITIINQKKDPHYNLALEEYVLKHVPIKEDIIMLWQNDPSIIVGRNQNTIQEINSTYVKKNNIPVVRRISGGGAVYHDLGNLNYTFITNNTKDNLNNYRKFTQPVITALQNLGVPAEFSGRNDIVVDGKKISGNAQSYHKDRMFHHGTILYNADLDMVAKVLEVSLDKIKSKGIKSNRSRVTNVYPYLEDKLSIQEFSHYLLTYILKTDNIKNKTYTLSSFDLDNIHKLMQEKYMLWDWNYGRSPKYSLKYSKRYKGGQVTFYFDIKDGIIHNCKIYGDFLGKKDVKEIEDLLIGHKFKEEEIRNVINSLTVDDYFYHISKKEILDCIFKED